MTKVYLVELALAERDSKNASIFFIFSSIRHKGEGILPGVPGDKNRDKNIGFLTYVFLRRFSLLF